MGKMINGYTDIHKFIMNERKIGGLIEARKIKLRSGEEYTFPVITNIDYCGGVFYSLSFVDDKGQSIMAHVNDVSVIESPTHKRVCECQNQLVKEIKVGERSQFLKRLCEVNEGSCTELFLDEAKMIIDDIGIENVKNEIDLAFLNENKKKIYKIA